MSLMPIFSPAAAAVLSVAYVTKVKEETNDTGSHTLSSVALGAAAADRQILVNAYASMDAVAIITGVTIGGVSATEFVVNNGGGKSSGFYMASVPSGTTGDIVISINTGTGELWGAAVYRITGGAATSASDTASYNTSTSPATLTISCPAGGAIFAGGLHNDGGTAVWAEITELWDEAMSGAQKWTGAWDEFDTQQTDLAVTATLGSVSMSFTACSIEKA